jgi:hypothetical protein
MSSSLRRLVFHSLRISCLLATTAHGAERKGFEVSGWITTTQLSVPGAGAAPTNSRIFVLESDGSKLFIRYNAGTADRGVDYTEFGTDGTNGFHFAKTRLRANPSSSRGLQNDATMRIEPSPLPQLMAVTIQHLWLLYAAQLESANPTNSFQKPQGPVFLRAQPFDQELQNMLLEHLLLRADWELDDQAPYLLKSYVEYRDGKLASDRFSQSLIPAEFMTGRTNARMDVLSWTNVAGLHIPIHARLTTFITDTGKPGQPLRANVIHQFVATNIVAGSTGRSFIPKLSTATQISDYRFAKGPRQPASYLATNGIIWATEEEAWAEVERQNEASARRRNERRPDAE